MTPLMLSVLVFVGVTALLGVLAFVFADSGAKTAERLDHLTGKKRKEEEGTNILKKTAFDRERKSLIESLTPNLPSLHKLIEQADANIKASTLFAVGAVLG